MHQNIPNRFDGYIVFQRILNDIEWEEKWIGTGWHNTTLPFENPLNKAVELVCNMKNL